MTAEPTDEPERIGKPTGSEAKGGATGAQTPAGGGSTIANLVPEDPRTNDRVLLQDIYAQIDLGNL